MLVKPLIAALGEVERLVSEYGQARDYHTDLADQRPQRRIIQVAAFAGMPMIRSIRQRRLVQDQLARADWTVPHLLLGPSTGWPLAGRAYHADSALAAEAELCALAAELDRTHPGAAASLRAGVMMRPSTPPDDHRAAAEVPRNLGHPRADLRDGKY